MKLNKIIFRTDSVDWCHLCGERTKPLIGINVPENAEHKLWGKRTYVRICARCIAQLHDALQ